MLKEPTHKIPAKSHIDQLHNEFVITSQLADVPGIRSVHGKEGIEGRLVLLLEYYNRLDEYEFQKLIYFDDSMMSKLSIITPVSPKNKLF